MKKLLLVLVVLALAGTAQAADYTLDNADFELGTWYDQGWGVPSPPGVPTGWGGMSSGEALAEIVGNGGGLAVKLEVAAIHDPGGYSFMWNQNWAEVTEGDTLTLSADIIDLTPGVAVADFAFLHVGGYEAKIAGVTSSWGNFSIDFLVPAGVTSVEVKIGLSTDSPSYPNTAAAYGFDNVVLTPEPITIALLGLGGLFLRRRK